MLTLTQPALIQPPTTQPIPTLPISTLQPMAGFQATAIRTISGHIVDIRPVRTDDVERLQRYFRSLPKPTRYRRFMGAINELSPEETARITGQGAVPTIAVVAEVRSDVGASIIGEANCALDLENRHGDLAVSVDDRWQGGGIGFALVDAIEGCAVRLGLRRLFGEALQSNEPIKALARRAGFSVARPHGDWTVVQFDKHLSASAARSG
jgi:GNAT superfamily N-acetyltransferase